MHFLKTSFICILFLILAAGIAYAEKRGDQDALRAVDLLCTRQLSVDGLDQSIAILQTELDTGVYSGSWRAARSFVLLGEKLSSKDARIADFEQGLEYGEKSVKLNPGGVEGYYWQARAMSKLGMEKGLLSVMKLARPMKTALDKALELDPKNPAVHAALAHVYYRSPGWPISFGDKKKAVSHALQAVKAAPNDVYYNKVAAEAYLFLNDEKNSRHYLDIICKLPVGAEDPERDRDLKEWARQELKKLGQ